MTARRNKSGNWAQAGTVPRQQAQLQVAGWLLSVACSCFPWLIHCRVPQPFSNIGSSYMPTWAQPAVAKRVPLSRPPEHRFWATCQVQ